MTDNTQKSTASNMEAKYVSLPPEAFICLSRTFFGSMKEGHLHDACSCVIKYLDMRHLLQNQSTGVYNSIFLFARHTKYTPLKDKD